MNKKGKLILFRSAEKNLLASTKKKGNEISYGWTGEDYRQAIVSEGIENAIAQPEDFIGFPFRHLTATIVGAGTWKATEFSEKVLRRSAKLLTHKPVFVNHTLETNNNVGANGQIKFVPASGNIPAGLEGPIWIDGKLHQDITRKLSAFPVPSIQSVSVTVSYEWEPSHEFTDSSGDPDGWEFERQIGRMVDGKMVRRVVTKIIDFYETSLVWLGADPYAKILGDDGSPINVEWSNVVKKSSFEKDPLLDQYKKGGLMLVVDDSISKENIVKLKSAGDDELERKRNLALKNEQINRKKMQDKLIAALAKKLGMDSTELTESHIDGIIIASPNHKTELDAAKKLAKDKGDKLTLVQSELDAAKETIEEFSKICASDDLEEFSKEVALESVLETAKFGHKVLEAKREECIAKYKLSLGEGKEPNETMVETLKTCSVEVLDAHLEQYGSRALEDFGATCSKCGTGDYISMRSTVSEGDEGKDNTESFEDSSDQSWGLGTY